MISACPDLASKFSYFKSLYPLDLKVFFVKKGKSHSNILCIEAWENGLPIKGFDHYPLNSQLKNLNRFYICLRRVFSEVYCLSKIKA